MSGRRRNGLVVLADGGLAVEDEAPVSPPAPTDEEPAPLSWELVAAEWLAADCKDAIAALRTFWRDEPWERIPAEGLVTTVYDPWYCYACGAQAICEGDEPPETGEHYVECGWLLARMVLANNPEPHHNVPSVAGTPDHSGVLNIAKSAANMGLCSQTHHEHLMVDARHALDGIGIPWKRERAAPDVPSVATVEGEEG